MSEYDANNAESQVTTLIEENTKLRKALEMAMQFIPGMTCPDGRECANPGHSCQAINMVWDAYDKVKR